jgi:hypothetical protein
MYIWDIYLDGTYVGYEWADTSEEAVKEYALSHGEDANCGFYTAKRNH